MEKEMIFCQSCGMALTDDVLGINADGRYLARGKISNKFGFSLVFP